MINRKNVTEHASIVYLCDHNDLAILKSFLISIGYLQKESSCLSSDVRFKSSCCLV